MPGSDGAQQRVRRELRVAPQPTEGGVGQQGHAALLAQARHTVAQRAGVERVTSAVRGSPTARVLVGRLPLAAGLSALLLPLIAVGALAIVWPGGGQPPGEFDRFGPAGAALLTGQ